MVVIRRVFFVFICTGTLSSNVKWIFYLVKEEDVNFLKAAIGEGSSDEQVRGVLSTK